MLKIMKKSKKATGWSCRMLKNTLTGNQSYSIYNKTKNYTFTVHSNLNDREREIILSGGLLPNTKKHIQVPVSDG